MSCGFILVLNNITRQYDPNFGDVERRNNTLPIFTFLTYSIVTDTATFTVSVKEVNIVYTHCSFFAWLDKSLTDRLGYL